MDTEYCEECEGPMNLIQRSTGETFLSCQQCGGTRENDEGNLINENEDIGSTYVFSGEGARPTGFRNGGNKHQVSKGRKKGTQNIQILCHHFNLSDNLQKMIQSVFARVVCQNLDAAAGGTFLSVLRKQENRNISEQITLRQVSSILGIPVPKIAKALKFVDKLKYENEEPSNGKNAVGVYDVCGLIRSVLPQFELYDPFLPSKNITQRVQNLTEKIIQLVQRRSSKSIDPNFITIAAGYLAWQSCFFYQKAHHGQVPLDSLKTPAKMSTLNEYLILARMTISVTLVNSIQRVYGLIIKEFKEMLEKMPWIKTSNVKTLVPQHLEQILQCQGLTCDILQTEAEIKRRNEPIITPIVPRELSTEEEAVLDAPELSEKDLPEQELAGYLRSSKEVESLKQWMDSSTSDDETD